VATLNRESDGKSLKPKRGTERGENTKVVEQLSLHFFGMVVILMRRRVGRERAARQDALHSTSVHAGQQRPPPRSSAVSARIREAST
jgi:hypothetical protein